MTSDQIAIIDYGGGNALSVKRALERVSPARVTVTRCVVDVQEAAALVLPGVGAFGSCMERFSSSGLRPAVETAVFDNGVPLLGICVGMQMLASRSEELGLHEGLGWIEGEVQQIPDVADLKVPHVGWSSVESVAGASPMCAEMNSKFFYFDHGYHFVPSDAGVAEAVVHYGELSIVAAVRKGRIFGVQFHPEKSQIDGLRVLKNFLREVGVC